MHLDDDRESLKAVGRMRSMAFFLNILEILGKRYIAANILYILRRS